VETIWLGSATAGAGATAVVATVARRLRLRLRVDAEDAEGRLATFVGVAFGDDAFVVALALAFAFIAFITGVDTAAVAFTAFMDLCIAMVGRAMSDERGEAASQQQCLTRLEREE